MTGKAQHAGHSEATVRPAPSNPKLTRESSLLFKQPTAGPAGGNGNISSHVPLARFKVWQKIKPAYPHILGAPRYSSQDWQSNLLSFYRSPLLLRVRSHLLANGLLAVLIYGLYVSVPAASATFEALSNAQTHTLTAGALGLLLVFRTNAAYARYHEARLIWGSVTNTIRDMGRVAHSNLSGLDREHALMLTAALPSVLLQHLQTFDGVYRKHQWSEAQTKVLSKLLSESDLTNIWAARNRPYAVCKLLGAVYRSWYYDTATLAKRFGSEDGTHLSAVQSVVMMANIQVV
jgi:hypothetical protein